MQNEITYEENNKNGKPMHLLMQAIWELIKNTLYLELRSSGERSYKCNQRNYSYSHAAHLVDI